MLKSIVCFRNKLKSFQVFFFQTKHSLQLSKQPLNYRMNLQYCQNKRCRGYRPKRLLSRFWDIIDDPYGNHTHFHNHTWQLKNVFLHYFFTSSILIWGGTHLFGTVNRSLDKILTSVFRFRVKNNGTSYFIVFEKEAYLVCM